MAFAEAVSCTATLIGRHFRFLGFIGCDAILLLFVPIQRLLRIGHNSTVTC